MEKRSEALVSLEKLGTSQFWRTLKQYAIKGEEHEQWASDWKKTAAQEPDNRSTYLFYAQMENSVAETLNGCVRDMLDEVCAAQALIVNNYPALIRKFPEIEFDKEFLSTLDQRAMAAEFRSLIGEILILDGASGSDSKWAAPIAEWKRRKRSSKSLQQKEF